MYVNIVSAYLPCYLKESNYYKPKKECIMMLEKYNMEHRGSIKSWDEAMPLGNGRLGTLVYGDEKICLSLDRVDLWDSRPAPASLEASFNYKNLVMLKESGKEEDWQELIRLFDTVYRATAYPSKVTAGRLELSFKEKFSPSFYLSIANAVALVKDDKDDVRLEGFLSATDFVGVLRIKGEYDLDIHIPSYISKSADEEANSSGICNERGLGYPPAEIVKDGKFSYTIQRTHTDFVYSIILFEREMGEWRELYFTIGTSADGEDYIERCKDNLREAANTGYSSLLSSHCEWWREYWSKSSISLGDEIIEQVYYHSTYLFASCSRKGFYPMPLQGVWTADNDMLPPWKGDYHHDTNTQLSYQAYLKANRLPEGEVFIDYLWDLREAFRRYAREFFGVNGLLIPGVSTIDGKPMGGWAQYAMSPTMSIWTAQSFDEYYLYTGDEAFLRERAYPFMSEIGEAISDLLVERDGRLYLPLSSSPEIHDNRREAYLEPNSNFDLALLLYLYRTLLGYSKKLDDKKAAMRWDSILLKLDSIAIDNGSILLCRGEALRESHRHFSHLMCLYPLHLINYDTPQSKAIYERAIYDLEKYGTGMWIGFSYAMAAQVYAMAQKGNGAYQNLYTFAHGFVGENGFHRNGDFKHYGYSTFHYRPFTLESSFGFCDALHEMLLQDHMGYIHLFPAIPDEWKCREISFNRLRSRGGVLVSAVRDYDGVREVRLTAEREQKVRIYLPESLKSAKIKAGGALTMTENGFLTVDLPACAEVIITVCFE